MRCREPVRAGDDIVKDQRKDTIMDPRIDINPDLDPATQDHVAVDGWTPWLLRAGVLAGPLFVVTVTAQMLVRDGYDLLHHPLSMLALGEGGWVQSLNFVVAGILSLAFAIGLVRVLRIGPGRRAIPILLGLYGVGLVLGGIFTADPALGFPPGAPEGIQPTLSAHATVHAFAPMLAFLSLIVAALVVARRLWWQERRGIAVASALVSLVCFVLSVPIGSGSSVRLYLAITIAFAWLTAYAVSVLRLRRNGEHSPQI